MFITPLFFCINLLISLNFIFIISYITPVDEFFWLNDNYILYVVFAIVFFYKNKYYDEISCNEEEWEIDKDEKINYDFYIRYVDLFISELWLFYNYLFTNFKKYNIFFKKFKYVFTICSVNLFFRKKLKNNFILWRPIFKKWSYLGYYRSNRSKWIK